MLLCIIMTALLIYQTARNFALAALVCIVQCTMHRITTQCSPILSGRRAGGPVRAVGHGGPGGLRTAPSAQLPEHRRHRRLLRDRQPRQFRQRAAEMDPRGPPLLSAHAARPHGHENRPALRPEPSRHRGRDRRSEPQAGLDGRGGRARPVDRRLPVRRVLGEDPRRRPGRVSDGRPRRHQPEGSRRKPVAESVRAILSAAVGIFRAEADDEVDDDDDVGVILLLTQASVLCGMLDD